MSIDIDEVFVMELEREIKMLEKIKSANLDETSKRQVRQRSYDQYNYYKSLLDLENIRRTTNYAKRKTLKTVLPENG